MDTKFGLLIETQKGRTYKFDDFHCYENYLKENKPSIQNTWVVAFDDPGKLLKSKTSYFSRGPSVKSPMGSGVAFFRNAESSIKTFPDFEQNGSFDQLQK